MVGKGPKTSPSCRAIEEFSFVVVVDVERGREVKVANVMGVQVCRSR